MLVMFQILKAKCDRNWLLSFPRTADEHVVGNGIMSSIPEQMCDGRPRILTFNKLTYQ